MVLRLFPTGLHRTFGLERFNDFQGVQGLNQEGGFSGRFCKDILDNRAKLALGGIADQQNNRQYKQRDQPYRTGNAKN